MLDGFNFLLYNINTMDKLEKTLPILYEHAWNFVWVLTIFGAIYYFIETLKKSYKGEERTIEYVGKFKNDQPEYRLVPNKSELMEILILIGVFFLVRFSVIALGFVMKGIGDPEFVFKWKDLGWHLTKWDSNHYIGIAQRWYVSDPEADARFHIVFYPMYPILMRLFSYICGGNFSVASILQPNVFAAVSIAVMYKLLRIDFSKRVTVISILMLIFSPYAFFLNLPFVESTFLLFSLLFLLMVKREKWLIAGIFGCLAALTKVFGLLLIVPYGVWLITVTCKKHDKWWKFVLNVLPAFLVLLGFGIYLYINYDITGNWFQYAIYQKEHWHNEMSCILENTVNHFEWFLTYPDTNISKWTIMFANVVTAILSMFAIWANRKRMPFIYNIYALASLAGPLAASWLISFQRYMVPIFPIFVSYAMLTDRIKNKTVGNIVVGILLVIGYLLSILVMTGFLCNAQIM